MPKWLAKEYGPFTGTVWVVVIVGGVGLGLLMRRYMAGRESASPAVTEPEYVGDNPMLTGTGTLYNQGEIVSDVLEAINAQKPPPATTNPIPPPAGGGPGGSGPTTGPAPAKPAQPVGGVLYGFKITDPNIAAMMGPTAGD